MCWINRWLIVNDGDFSHEIKICLLLGRKAMTNLDCILKSRDITLLTNVRIVKAMIFFLAVMYKCDSWTIKKAERWRTDDFTLWFWKRLLRVPWTARRSNQSVLKEINHEYSLEVLVLKLKLQYFGYQIQRATSLEKNLMLGKIEGKGRRGQQRMRSLNSTTNSMDMNLSKLWEIMEDRGAWHAEVHGVTKSQLWLTNWTTTIINEILYEITINQDDFWRCWTKRKGEKKHHSDLYLLNPTLKQTLKMRQPPLSYVLELIHEEATLFPVSSPLLTFAWSLWLSELQLNPGREERAEWAWHSGKSNCQRQERPENNAFVHKFTLHSLAEKNDGKCSMLPRKKPFPHILCTCVCVCVCVC